VKRRLDSEGWNWKDATGVAGAAAASPAIFQRSLVLLLQRLSVPLLDRVGVWNAEGKDYCSWQLVRGEVDSDSGSYTCTNQLLACVLTCF
jgi:hypothetical protein